MLVVLVNLVAIDLVMEKVEEEEEVLVAQEVEVEWVRLEQLVLPLMLVVLVVLVGLVIMVLEVLVVQQQTLL